MSRFPSTDPHATDEPQTHTGGYLPTVAELTDWDVARILVDRPDWEQQIIDHGPQDEDERDKVWVAKLDWLTEWRQAQVDAACEIFEILGNHKANRRGCRENRVNKPGVNYNV